MADTLANQIATNDEEENNFLTGLENSEFQGSDSKAKKTEKEDSRKSNEQNSVQDGEKIRLDNSAV